MINVLYVEISSIGIILLVIILITQRRTVGSSTLQRQFNNLIFTAIAMLIVDSVCWMIDGATFANARTWSYIAESAFYACQLLLPYMWAVYVESALSTDRKAARRRLIVAAVPVLILIGFLPLNVRMEYVFSIDAQNVYHRQPAFLMYAVFSFALMFYASIRALIKAKSALWAEDRRHCYTMAFFIVLPAVGGILQTLFYGVSFSWTLAAISILLVFLDMQNRQISTDPLTGLNNRRELDKFLLHEARDTQREGVLALLMIDVDGFKLINDTYGHFYGDDVLVAVGKTLKLSCKNTEAFLGRYGGDEFCIVYSAANEDAVETLIDEIHRNLRSWNEAHPRFKPIGLSIGYSVFDPQNGDCTDELIRRADCRMYEEKKAKKCA